MKKLIFLLFLSVLVLFAVPGAYAVTNKGSGSQGGSNTQNKSVQDQGEETQKLNDSMSSVAQQVQTLLNSDSASGGIGDQVREWAHEQVSSQEKVQTYLDKLDEKTGLARRMFGPNYKSLNALKKEMNQNNVRIQQLEQLKLKLGNQADIQNVEEVVALMEQENTVLQERIIEEEQDSGVFGWLLRLFAK